MSGACLRSPYAFLACTETSLPVTFCETFSGFVTVSVDEASFRFFHCGEYENLIMLKTKFRGGIYNTCRWLSRRVKEVA